MMTTTIWLRAFGRISTIKIRVDSHNRAFRVSMVFPIEAMRQRTWRKIGYQWSPLANEWEKRIAAAEAIFSSLVFFYRVPFHLPSLWQSGGPLETVLPMRPRQTFTVTSQRNIFAWRLKLLTITTTATT